MFLESLSEEEATTAPASEGLCRELPHHYSKRSLYKRWCWERGWVIQNDARSNETKEERSPVDDEFWTEDKVPEPTLSWPSFRNYWKKHFPHLRIRDAKA